MDTSEVGVHAVRVVLQFDFKFQHELQFKADKWNWSGVLLSESHFEERRMSNITIPHYYIDPLTSYVPPEVPIERRHRVNGVVDLGGL